MTESKRKNTRAVKAGGITIGGGAPVSIQSMTTENTKNVDAVVCQIERLSDAGCDLVRLAVTDDADVSACKAILQKSVVPLIADIQFDYRLAIKCSDIGFAKVRFNPGNIGGEDGVKSLVSACKQNGTAVRVGANTGSLDKRYAHLKRHEALAMSVLAQVRLLEDCGFYDTVLSVKSSDVRTTIDAYRFLSGKCDYPLHLGVTESGWGESGFAKSAIGIGALLADGIGDTIRVSLTGDPTAEPIAAKRILRALDMYDCCQVVSCPTCARCKIDLLPIVRQVEQWTEGVKKRMKIAVMGCVVNGPGEASDADFGVAGGDGKAVLFKKGAVYKTVAESEILGELKKLIEENV